MKNTPAIPGTTEPLSPLLRTVAQFVLAGLLMVLALRMTMTETLYQSFGQISAQFAARFNPNSLTVAVPEIGPAVTLALSAITLLLVAAAAWCASIAHALTLGRVGRFALIMAILGLGLYSTLAAANRFEAIVGLSDLALSLLAGWAVMLLCGPRMLGASGRRMIIAFLIAMLAIWTAKGFYQRLIDIPDTIAYYNKHKAESLASQGLHPGDPQVKLYESRMNSKEVTGYVTLSNVMAAGMIALLAIAAALLAGRFLSASSMTKKAAPPESDKSTRKPGDIQIPTDVLLGWIAVLILLAGTAVLFLSESRGGSVLGVGCVLAISLGAYCWKAIAPWRRFLVGGLLVLFVAGMAAIVAYGVTHDRLPTKSLMFRWQYWTASAPLIERHPVTGVGFYNFGDYYPSVKRASSPEDVRDPHSFFVRLASEAGIPVAVLVAVLLLWEFLASTRTTDEIAPARLPQSDENLRGLLYIVAFCVIWWTLHLLIAEPSNSYSLILSILSAIICITAWMMAKSLLSLLDHRGLRCVVVGGLLGAFGMLIYDQINMALVTGPVATLFWVLLGLADSYEPVSPATPADKAPAIPQMLGSVAGILTLGGALALAVTVWWPTLNNAMPWDPNPAIIRYLQSLASSTHDWQASKSFVEEALRRDPRNISLHLQLMAIDQELHEPLEEELHRILDLDRTGARLRIRLAHDFPSIPAPERLHLLRQALELNNQLPLDEITRLSPQEIGNVENAINQLQATTEPASTTR